MVSKNSELALRLSPTLAKSIGVNHALFIQKVHDFICKQGVKVNGSCWYRSSYDKWDDVFPFWSSRTIKRIVNKLRECGLLVTTSEYNESTFDKTLWYTIDYDELDRCLSY